MASAFVFRLIRKDVIPSKHVVLYFAKSLLSDIDPIRALGLRVLECILGTFQGNEKIDNFEKENFEKSTLNDSNIAN